MIVPMKKIAVYGLNRERKTVMEKLQKSGCVEFFKPEDSELDSPEVTEAIMQFDKYISLSSQAIAVLDEYVPEKTGMFSVRRDISIDKFSMNPKEISTVGNVALDIVTLKKNLHENLLKIGSLNSKLAAIEQWKSLDIPMNFSGTDEVKAGLYTFPKELSVQEADSMFEKCEDSIYYELISSSKDVTCVFILYTKASSEEVEKLLRETGFVHPSVGMSHRTPSDKIKSLKKKIEELYSDNEKITAKIKESAKSRDNLKLLYDHLILRRDKYKSLEKVSLTSETFIIEGYIPQKRCDYVRTLLEKDSFCVVEFFDAPRQEAPVQLQNNSFVRPVEGITRSYSMPSPTDIDPNAVMSIFYYLFFGMMFSDAGYGLLMVLAAGYIGFIAKVESATRQNMRMFFYCGLSTMFWGFMYGSFFGDILPMLKPIWINPVNEPLKLLIFSICLGAVQIVVGLILKFYVDYRAGNKASAIFDTGSWIIILLGAAVAAGGYALGSNAALNAGVVIAVIGVVMVVLMRNRETRNPFKRIISGIIGLYDITSYVSDFLSYSRLMALGLATGVIAQVVNIMCKIVGGGVVGTIAFVLIFVFGHLLNFAINVLGAYVHTNRLQYVEFYSKFYEGGGKEFAPLGMNTKYFNFMEDEK